MVEENENKKRRGLFGSRRAARKSLAIRKVPSVPSAASPHALQNVDALTPSTDPASGQAPATVPDLAPAKNQDTTVTDIVSPDSPPEEVATAPPVRLPSTSLLFQAPDVQPLPARAGNRQDVRANSHDDDENEETTTVRRRARRRS